MPAEVVIAQSEAAGIVFPRRELLPSQRRGVPVDALLSWPGDAQGAAVALTLTHNALLIRVCPKKDKKTGTQSYLQVWYPHAEYGEKQKM